MSTGDASSSQISASLGDNHSVCSGREFYHLADWTGPEHSWLEAHMDALNQPSDALLEKLISGFHDSFSRKITREDIHNKWISLVFLIPPYTQEGPGQGASTGSIPQALPATKPRTSPRLKAKANAKANGKPILSPVTTTERVSKKSRKALQVKGKCQATIATINAGKLSHGAWTDVIIPGDNALEASYLKNGFPSPGDMVYYTVPPRRLHPLHPKYSYITKALKEKGHTWGEICWLFGRQEDIPRWPKSFPKRAGKFMLTIGTRALDMRKSRV